MEIIFHSLANKTHFDKKGCALGLILKVRVFGTRKWPIPYYRNCKGNGYKLSAKRFVGSFGWTSVSHDWLMAALRTMTNHNQSLST